MEIFSYTNPSEALKQSVNHQIDVAFLDIEMPMINGIMLAKELKKNNPDAIRMYRGEYMIQYS